jgi:nitrogen regulatory protein PII
MQLLICVLNREDHLQRVLAGFVDLGIVGATVISSEGMGRLMSREMPVLASLQSVIDASRPQNSTLFSVIEDEGKLESGIALIQKVCGGLEHPGTGILFTVPVSEAYGLASRLDG